MKMRNWKNSMERTFELLLVMGIVLIVIGFINLGDYSPGEIIVSGVIILLIGAYGILRKIKKKGRKKK